MHAERLKVSHCFFLAELRPLRSDQRPWNLALWKWHRRHQSDLMHVSETCMDTVWMVTSTERSGIKRCCGTILKLTVGRVSLPRKLYSLVDKCRPIWCHTTLRLPFDGDLHSAMLVDFFEVESLRWRVSALQRPGADPLWTAWRARQWRSTQKSTVIYIYI